MSTQNDSDMTGRPPEGSDPQPEQNAELDAMTPEERRRFEAREAARRYKGLLALAAEFIEVFTLERRIDMRLLARLEDDVFGYFFDVNGPLVFENLQLARYDSKYYQYHLVNVALLNAVIGKQINRDWDWLRSLVRIGLLTDLGMLQMPTRITSGKEALSDTDRVRIRQHPQGAVRMLETAGITDKMTADAVLHHHERYNGDGYPGGLAGEAIPLEARITAVSDSFDAALARKAYRTIKGPFDVLAEFAENQGGGLDPTITQSAVDVFSGMLMGRHVMLSDHSIGVVTFVDPYNLAYPEVRVLGREIQTGPELYPLSLTTHVPLR